MSNTLFTRQQLQEMCKGITAIDAVREVRTEDGLQYAVRLNGGLDMFVSKEVADMVKKDLEAKH